MSPKWTTDDGDFFVADERELISRLRTTGIAQATDDPAYMEAVARRVYGMTGKVIPTDDPVKFVEALIDVGLVWRDK